MPELPDKEDHCVQLSSCFSPTRSPAYASAAPPPVARALCHLRPVGHGVHPGRPGRDRTRPVTPTCWAARRSPGTARPSARRRRLRRWTPGGRRPGGVDPRERLRSDAVGGVGPVQNGGALEVATGVDQGHAGRDGADLARCQLQQTGFELGQGVGPTLGHKLVQGRPLLGAPADVLPLVFTAGTPRWRLVRRRVLNAAGPTDVGRQARGRQGRAGAR
jgi:hypothetical protein